MIFFWPGAVVKSGVSAMRDCSASIMGDLFSAALVKVSSIRCLIGVRNS